MLLKVVEQIGGATGVKPVCPRGPPPPIRVVAQIHRSLCPMKNHGTRNKVLSRGTWKIRWIERALGHGRVASLSNEAGELFVSDRVAIDPEAANSYFMDRTLLHVKLFRTHAKRSARNPVHVRMPSTVRTTDRGLDVGHLRPQCGFRLRTPLKPSLRHPLQFFQFLAKSTNYFTPPPEAASSVCAFRRRFSRTFPTLQCSGLCRGGNSAKVLSHCWTSA